MRALPDTSYINVDNNYRGPAGFGTNSCSFSTNFTVSSAATPPDPRKNSCIPGFGDPCETTPPDQQPYCRDGFSMIRFPINTSQGGSFWYDGENNTGPKYVFACARPADSVVVKCRMGFLAAEGLSGVERAWTRNEEF
jgi:hypothetical protein